MITRRALLQGMMGVAGIGIVGPLGRILPQPPGAPTVANRPVIKVIGIGGGGCLAVQAMREARLAGADLIEMNTDIRGLRGQRMTCTPAVVQIGLQQTRGWGCRGEPDVGRRAAIESCSDIDEIVSRTLSS